MNGTQLLNVHAENLAENKVFSGFWELHRAAVTVLVVSVATTRRKSLAPRLQDLNP